MGRLQDFIQVLTGQFDNSSQYTEMQQNGRLDFPYARHVNTPCNDKISGLPEDFPGCFLLEESYYTTKGHTNAMPHLFLFTQEGDAVKLSSYELPEALDKKTLCYQTLPRLPYDQLKPSERFTPALYRLSGGVWEGGSESMFSPVLKFKLFERFSVQQLEVSESMEMNGKRTFGYDVPIVYQRK